MLPNTQTIASTDAPAAAKAESEWLRAAREWRPSRSQMTLAAVLIALLMALRGYNLVADATFAPDDGHTFFEPAYNSAHPLLLLITPYAGYYHLIPRIAAAISALVPLAWSPRVGAALALTITTAPIFYLMSERLPGLEHPTACVAAAVLYAIIPYPEVFGETANIHFMLWPVMLTIVLSRPPSSRLARGVEFAGLVACGLSGPEAIFAAASLWAITLLKGKPRRMELIVITLCAAVEFAQVLHISTLPNTQRILQLKPYAFVGAALIFCDAATPGFASGAGWLAAGILAAAANILEAFRARNTFLTATIIAASLATAAACLTFDSGDGAPRYHTYATIACVLSFAQTGLLKPRRSMDYLRLFAAASIVLTAMQQNLLIPPSFQTRPSWRRQVATLFDPLKPGQTAVLAGGVVPIKLALKKR